MRNFSNRTIVIVDDDPNKLSLYSEYLSSEGYQVHTAATGNEGYKLISEVIPDLAILDLVLPDVSGASLCSQLRSQLNTKSIPIILCTAHDISTQEKVRGFSFGADDYLVLPFELSELSARVGALLRRSVTQPKHDTLAGIQEILKQSFVPSVQPSVPAPSLTVSPSLTSGEVAPAADLSLQSNIVSTPVSSDIPPISSHRLFKHLWRFLNHPAATFRTLKESDDFFLAVLLVFATPTLTSFLKLFQKAGGFDAWIGFFSLGVVIHLTLWFATAGLLHMVVPFQGITLPMKKSLMMVGFSWAPRLLEAGLGLIYGVLSQVVLAGETSKFSSGIDVIPGLSNSGLADFLSRFGLFNFWSVWLLLIGVWTLGHAQRPRWNFVSVFVGGACLLFGVLASY
ncbi:MAG: Regulator of RpoS [Elusimicrobia bacterium]|nr:Regulator of RpoS [Elusimicrobiota bacterium]